MDTHTTLTVGLADEAAATLAFGEALASRLVPGMTVFSKETWGRARPPSRAAFYAALVMPGGSKTRPMRWWNPTNCRNWPCTILTFTALPTRKNG